MKKILSLILCAVLLAAIVPMTASAAGILLFNDQFNTLEQDNWMADVSLYECIDGHIEGYSQAVVLQSQFSEDYGGNKMWGDGTAFKAETWCYDDDAGHGENELKLWWADYFGGTWDNESRIVYYFGYNFGTHKVVLRADYVGPDAEQYYVNGESSVEIFSKDYREIRQDLANPEHFTLGFRVNKGIITYYINDELIYTHQAERGLMCGTEGPAPLILWNTGCYCGWDNVQVATADYDLFNEGTVTEPAVTDPAQTDPASPVTQAPDTTAVVEKVVTEVGEDGEVVTKIVTEIVTNAPAADTQKQPDSGNFSGGAKTGDMAVIVIAVMIAALGAAVVVKKVNE